MEWFIENRPEMSERNMANMKGALSCVLIHCGGLLKDDTVRGRGERRLLALASKERLERILQVMLDEDEFLSDHGIRSYVHPCRTRRSDLTLIAS